MLPCISVPSKETMSTMFSSITPPIPSLRLLSQPRIPISSYIKDSVSYDRENVETGTLFERYTQDQRSEPLLWNDFSSLSKVSLTQSSTDHAVLPLSFISIHKDLDLEIACLDLINPGNLLIVEPPPYHPVSTTPNFLDKILSVVSSNRYVFSLIPISRCLQQTQDTSIGVRARSVSIIPTLPEPTEDLFPELCPSTCLSKHEIYINDTTTNSDCLISSKVWDDISLTGSSKEKPRECLLTTRSA